MEDHDRLVPGLDYSDWFRSGLRLTWGYLLDLNGESPGLPPGGGTVLRGIAGNRRDSWEWEARDGEHLYSGGNGTVGALPADQLGITSHQWYEVPSLGLGIKNQPDRVSLAGRLITSPIAYATDRDTHHLPNLY